MNRKYLLLLLVAVKLLTTSSEMYGMPLDGEDFSALTIVQRALDAMGGAVAWKTAGGVTAKAVIRVPGLPERDVLWSDDWRTGKYRYRREITRANKTYAVVGGEAAQVGTTGSPEVKRHSSANSITLSSFGYPALALMLALDSSSCTFKQHSSSPQAQENDVEVTETCTAQSALQRSTIIVWRFAKATGLPVSVRIPLQTQFGNAQLFETIRYIAFSNQQGLVYPTELESQHIAGSVQRISIENTTFSSSIEGGKF